MPLIQVVNERDRIKLIELINKHRWRGSRSTEELFFFADEKIIEKLRRAGVHFSEVTIAENGKVKVVGR